VRLEARSDSSSRERESRGHARAKMTVGPSEERSPESSSKPLGGALGLTAQGAEQSSKRGAETSTSGKSKEAECK
jgi:hypothetical protein